MSQIIIKDTRIVNEGQIIEGDLLVKNGRIEKLGGVIDTKEAKEINGHGLHLLPGVIDDQVHFRQPGLTHKADIASESRAAAAGGTTSFMEMPNTKPTATTQGLLEDKYVIAKDSAFTNYSFYMGATNDNLEEVLKTNSENVCGVKIFMGSSTGNMLVDNRQTLDYLFSNVDMLIATHCEDEQTIRRNKEEWKDKSPTPAHHPIIRSVEGCYLSSSMAVDLAKKHNTRLHILHISTQDEIALFDNTIPLKEKRITSEVCVHHLYFNADDYERLGTKIQCNPAIKAKEHQEALFGALLDNHFDVIATDHAPHTMEEKAKPYGQAPSGLPLVQHSLLIMLDYWKAGRISIERVVEKMSHAVADCFGVKERGYLREGYWADMVLVDTEKHYTVNADNVLFKCGWSPLDGVTFPCSIQSTFVNGHRVFDGVEVHDLKAGQRLLF